MKTQTGVVFRVHTKDYRGKNLYSFKLDGGGDNEWFRLGENRREGTVEEGYEIKLGYTEDRNGNLQVEKVKVLAKGEPVQAKSKSRGKSSYSKSSGGGAKGNSVDWAAKDAAIQYQSSRKDALEFVKMGVELKSIKLPAATKIAERIAALEGYVDLYTAKFFLDIASQGALSRADDELEVQDEAEEAPKAKKAKPADDGDDDWDTEDNADDGDEWDD